MGMAPCTRALDRPIYTTDRQMGFYVGRVRVHSNYHAPIVARSRRGDEEAFVIRSNQR